MPASVAARLAGVRVDSSFFYYLDGWYIPIHIIARLTTCVMSTYTYPVLEYSRDSGVAINYRVVQSKLVKIKPHSSGEVVITSSVTLNHRGNKKYALNP